MNRMSFGQYIPGKSPLHKMHAFAKLLSFFLLLAAIILTDTVMGYLLTVVCIFAIVQLSQIGYKAATASIRYLWLFFLFIILMNALFFETQKPLWSWWIFHLSTGGILQGINVVLRVILVMICANVLTSVTSSLEITKAIEILLTPLKWLHIPTGNVAMILGVAIQFIPTFLEETENIKKAQMARGAGFESDRFRDRAASIMPLVIPVFLSAFRRANELSIAMEARGYHPTRRKKMKKISFHRTDILAITLAYGICLMQIIL